MLPMKKIFFPLLTFFAIFFFSCKTSEFNLQARVEISSEFISQLLDGRELFVDGANNFDYSFCEITSDEVKKILKSMGGLKSEVAVNLEAQLSGLSLKKIYAKKGASVRGWISFENEIPEKPISAYENFKKENPQNSMEVNFSADKKRADFSYVFPDEAILFDSEKIGDKDINISEFENGNGKSKRLKNLSVKFRGGKIIIDPTKGIDGIDAQIIIERIRK